ncbi:SpoIIE family protein phosphatase [Streptomyces sp. SID8382]|uniref:SpoIIE family protein phosphatase n=1 Tax=Streptomyces malaysiensis TaxID=92644 RepID=UPI000C2BAB72|nr:MULTISPECIES: SpoIIE family protein phosphatase [unclassified Streptomyces]AUA15034.1 Phosphoserine phosphatase RsbU [Streptomyces sp. M56]MYX57663.1 SpoIIE family protein phosphatase [Streptomyces sp. SID8382]
MSSVVNEPLDMVYLATATMDSHGVVTGWSEGAQRLLGYRPEEIVGRAVTELWAGETAAEAVGRCVAGRSRWSGRVGLCHRDGHRMEAEALAHRVVEDGGATEWLLVSAVAREPRSPEADAAVEAFTQAPCVLAVFDTDLRLVRANAEMEAAVAVTEDRMRGMRLVELLSHPESDQAEEGMRRVLESGERQVLEAYLRVPGESRGHAWTISLAPLKDRTGRVYGVCFAAYDTTRRHQAQERLLLLNEAGKRIGSSLDLAHVAHELADVAVPRVADFVGVDLLTFLDQGEEPPSGPLSGPITMRRAAHRSVLPGTPEAVADVGELDTHPESSPSAECLADGAILYQVTDELMVRWEALDPVRAARIREFGIHSELVVPMRTRGVTLGVVFFARHRTPVPFDEDDLLLAEEITARAAVCVDNARRYKRERMTARALQRNLLPRRLPDLAAVEVTSRYLPSETWAGVGGDWFDVIPLSGARAALVVGDTTGRGVEASATMGRLRSAIRTLADIDLPPGELLTHLADLVTRLAAEDDPEPPGATGATCLYAVYDPVSRHCTLASAGHPPPVVVTPDGSVDIIDVPKGPPLGLSTLPFEAVETELSESSVLALYTDGLVEGQDRAIDEGLEALCEALAQPGPSLDALGDTVLRTLLPARPEDDVTLLLARARALGPDRVATWEIPPEPAVVSRIRQEATARLMDWGLEKLVLTTELVVSELVTNAIRYGRPPIRLRLIRDRALICEVSDFSSTAPHLRRARALDEGGRGLFLVAQLAQRWGTRLEVHGKTIWAEQDLSDD